ncbi:Uncharacterised protein [Mycobacteroides abscessus subsp. abscessus]|nr:Uncharacterised protein [Mycobacteroides abscessus subsp. abscessus]
MAATSAMLTTAASTAVIGTGTAPDPGCAASGAATSSGPAPASCELPR